MATTVFVPSPEELVEYLLAETNQLEPGPTEPDRLLDLLSLCSMSVNFATTLPEARTASGEAVRALLDYQERLIAVDASLNARRSRFSSLHEIGHYVLPDHHGQLVLCSERDLGFRAARVEEREANAFAAELQFKGRRFRLETATLPITAATVKATAAVFDASFESTARHLVETSLKPCLLAVYQDNGQSDDGTKQTSVRYSIASPSFAQRFGRRLTDDDNEHVATVWTPGRDIADSLSDDVSVETGDGETTRFRAEYFFNGHNAFCLITASKA